MKRWIAVILLAVLLCGCGSLSAVEETTLPENGEITLWVVTESTGNYGMNDQAQKLATQFEKAHKNVTIRLDILPESGEERDVYLEKLRTQIMAGKGPDVFLLPTYTEQSNSALFSDVTQAMYNSLFSDISQYYDADESLNTAGLNTVVMDAGCIGETRYVLPLRYDFTVLYATVESMCGYSLNLDSTEKNIMDLSKAVLEEGNSATARCVWGRGMFGFDLLSDPLDYASSEVLLSEEELAEYMALIQALKEQAVMDNISCETPILHYIRYGTCLNKHIPFAISYLSSALDYSAIAFAEQTDLKMYPIRSIDGDLVAKVTYYAAVGSGSNQPELAYSFIREFLKEEYQWAQTQSETTAMIESGWPVRSVGSTEYLWDGYKKAILNATRKEADQLSRRKKFEDMQITDDEITILTEQITRVRFPLAEEFELMGTAICSLYSGGVSYDVYFQMPDGSTHISMEWNTTTEVDIREIAKNLIQELKWHLAEG